MVIELFLSFLDVARHRYIHVSKSVIPIDCQTAVVFAFPVSGVPEISTYSIIEMIRIFNQPVFYAKIINTEAEFSRMFVMTP